jgi:hypothetical protein
VGLLRSFVVLKMAGCDAYGCKSEEKWPQGYPREERGRLLIMVGGKLRILNYTKGFRQLGLRQIDEAMHKLCPANLPPSLV